MAGVLVLLVAPALMAQTTAPPVWNDFGTGGGPSEVTTMVSKMYKTYKFVALSIAGFCAIIGGVKVYGKMQEGGSEGRRAILLWFSASLFCLFVGSFLDKIFGA